MIRTPQKAFKHFFDRSFIGLMSVMVVVLYSLAVTWTPETFFLSSITTEPHKNATFSMASKNTTFKLAKKINHTDNHIVEEISDKNLPSTHEELISTGIPRVFATHLPAELGMVINIKNKQDMFVETLLPHILKYNEDILADRTYLLRLKRIVDSGNSLSLEQRLWLQDLTKRYHLKRLSFDELLKRVDIIPASLALGQAVIESGWGGCKYARKQNSPFGFMQDKTQLITFDSLYNAVKAYMDTLNKHPAYDSLRRIRAQQRQDGLHPCSLKLADGLLYYSIRRQAYTRQLKELIDIHSLKQYDYARFKSDLRS
ncbi:MAG: glucosaminidase domain-containing protein [Candidatus Paracaedimonas acanthamoebae]|uniref:Glucosaminidase domain-containing protein n=1 Tax=Candidatus Paracaedimonas acanthamoebae TaxID=244581 RepID=A0A8J7TUR7_9PROT|nr:glucosaminidase domain-containing protein [Candidatus Paracaedimonas acanthamoebae]